MNDETLKETDWRSIADRLAETIKLHLSNDVTWVKANSEMKQALSTYQDAKESNLLASCAEGPAPSGLESAAREMTQALTERLGITDDCRQRGLTGGETMLLINVAQERLEAALQSLTDALKEGS